MRAVKWRAEAAEGTRMRVRHQLRDSSHAEIVVEGLDRSFRVYQFSDTHLQLADEQDPDLPPAWREDPSPRLPCGSEDLLQSHLDRAIDGGADLILMLGDLFHFPSPPNIRAARRRFDACPLPVLSVPGNHDWFYPGMDGWEPLRAAMLPRLAGLFPGGEHHAWCECFGGLRFVGLDNSAYYLDAGQAEFLRRVLSHGEPTVLLLHIPLSIPSIRQPVLEKFGSPLLMWDPEIDHEARRRPDVDLEATAAVVDCLANAENLIAVLSAHVHLSLQGPVSDSAMQYVSGAGYRHAHRFLSFRPSGDGETGCSPDFPCG